MDRPRTVAMAWYRPEDYARLRALMEDADRLPETFGQWLMSAEQVEGEVVRSGVAVTRTLIEPDAFVAWCSRHDLARTGSARSRYANETADPATRTDG